MRSTKMDFTIIKLAIGLAAILGYQTCFAQHIESHEHLKNITKEFIISKVKLEPEETMEIRVSSKIPGNLPVCTKEIVTDLPRNSSVEKIDSVELTCNGEKAWHVLVPVEVQIFAKVIVAKQSILPKDVISENDIDFSLFDKTRLFAGYYQKPEDIIGRVATHIIPAGSVLTKNNLQIPILIHRNQLIRIVARNNSVVVEMNGIAKSDGSENAIIQVFNPSSKRTLDAVVKSSNKAEVVS